MKLRIIVFSFVLFIIISVFTFFYLISVPADFPSGSIYTVDKGIGLSRLATDLYTNKIISSPFLFKVFSVLFGGTKGIIAGDYALSGKENVIMIANRISAGKFNLIPIKVTIPEGFNIFEIAKLLSSNFKKINYDLFVNFTKDDEGYLFPDTYLFLPNVEKEEVVKTMKDNFNEKINDLQGVISGNKRTLSDIIKMASILEEEARTTETRQVVAGILWRRLDIGMPLQVDSSFKYINGKGTEDLSLDDLKIDSPYNSYLYKGLPPTPICNPGIDSIRAAINPIKTDYLYFLTDKKGNMHYAKTFAEHTHNKSIYLR